MSHQLTLDGLRGLAAFAVLLYHIGHWLDLDIARNSFLAVDFFFVLSGYILSLVYKARFNNGLTFRGFMLIRLIRLMPLISAALVISGIYISLRLYLRHEEYLLIYVLISLVLGLFNIPFFSSPVEIGGHQVFPLNGPQWSLFFELVSNSLWGFFPKLREFYPAISLAILSFIVLAVVGVLGGDSPKTLVAGFPRVGASLFCGVALYFVKQNMSSSKAWIPIFWMLLSVTIFLFFIPIDLPMWIQMTWIIIVSPLLVLSGTQVEVPVRMRGAAFLLGEMSYPVYVLHYPIFVWVNGIYQSVLQRRDSVLEGCIVILSVLIGSYVMLKLFDLPLRKILRYKFLAKRDK